MAGLKLRVSRLETPSKPATRLGGYLGVGEKHYLKEKIDRGKLLLLSDGSLWEVSSLDRINTTLWMRLDDCVVLENDSSIYPYKIVNLSDKEMVEAKYLGKP